MRMRRTIMMVVARMMTTVRTTRTRKTCWLETDPLLPSVATRVA